MGNYLTGNDAMQPHFMAFWLVDDNIADGCKLMGMLAVLRNKSVCCCCRGWMQIDGSNSY